MQFSLKGVLIVVVVFSVIFAVAAPLVRLLAVDQQLRLAVFLIANVVCALAVAVGQCRKRYAVEQKCGERLVALTTDIRMLQIWVVGGVVIYAVMFLPLVINSPSTRWPFFGVIVFGANSGLYIARAVLSLWWRGVVAGVELCEHGIITSGVLFRPWADVWVHKWDSARGVLVLNSKKSFMTYKAAERDHDKVEQVIAGKHSRQQKSKAD